MCIVAPGNFNIESAERLERQLKKYRKLVYNLQPLSIEDLKEYRKLGLPEDDESWRNRKIQRVYMKAHDRYMKYSRMHHSVYYHLNNII